MKKHLTNRQWIGHLSHLSTFQVAPVLQIPSGLLRGEELDLPQRHGGGKTGDLQLHGLRPVEEFDGSQQRRESTDGGRCFVAGVAAKSWKWLV